MFRDIKGFTLIEVLIAIALFSIVVMSVYFNLFAGLRVYSKMGEQKSYLYDYQLAINKMERELHNVLNLKGFEFEGEKKKISFAAFGEYYDEDDVYEVPMELEYSFKANRLYRQWKKIDLGFDTEGTKSDLLLEKVKLGSFEFAYHSPDGEIKWQPEWQVADTLVNHPPIAVKMTFVEDKGKKGKNGEKEVKLVKVFHIPEGDWRELEVA